MKKTKSARDLKGMLKTPAGDRVAVEERRILEDDVYAKTTGKLPGSSARQSGDLMNGVKDLPVQERDSLKGMFGKPARTVSIDEMNAAISRRGSMIEMHKPPHPGEILAEYLGTLSLDDAAIKIGVPKDRLSAVLGGLAGIDGDLAAKLGKVFDTSLDLWTGMQAKYDQSNDEDL